MLTFASHETLACISLCYFIFLFCAMCDLGMVKDVGVDM